MPRLPCLFSEDQITHEIGLDDAPEPLTGLDVFKVDPDYEEHEKQYKAIMREVLGEDEVSDDEGGAGGDSVMHAVVRPISSGREVLTSVWALSS